MKRKAKIIDGVEKQREGSTARCMKVAVRSYWYGLRGYRAIVTYQNLNE